MVLFKKFLLELTAARTLNYTAYICPGYFEAKDVNFHRYSLSNSLYDMTI